MIAHLTGQLTHKAPTHVVLDVNGVGYEVGISLHTFSAIKALERCQLFICHYIKGDAQALYGFFSWEEKQCFSQLISVNGVGPRIALTILSSLTPSELEKAIVNGQVGVLKSIKGVGQRTAQRLVLELQSKMGHESNAVKDKSAVLRMDPAASEALAALTKLGIAPTVAEKALAKVCQACPEETSPEVLIKQVLQMA